MQRVTGIDHLSIRVSNIKKSRSFYAKLFKFLGFKLLDDFGESVGWTDGKTRFWIGLADKKGKKYKPRIGDVGFHHYAFQLRHRRDVDELYSFLLKEKVRIVDPADEYYEDYYAVFFLDPDGLKLEGMKYGELKQKKAQKKSKNAARKK